MVRAQDQVRSAPTDVGGYAACDCFFEEEHEHDSRPSNKVCRRSSSLKTTFGDEHSSRAPQYGSPNSSRCLAEAAPHAERSR
jgi:hypothetical protein